jgi:hypothetical protein
MAYPIAIDQSGIGASVKGTHAAPAGGASSGRTTSRRLPLPARVEREWLVANVRPEQRLAGGQVPPILNVHAVRTCSSPSVSLAAA